MRERMKALGWDCNIVASALGVSYSTVRKWHAGSRSPTLGHLVELAGLLDIDLAEVFADEEAEDAATLAE